MTTSLAPPPSAGARAGAYKLLADCYYPPTTALLQALRGEETGNGSSLLEGLVADQDSELIDLEKDYATLFLGPFEVLAPLYGSVYLEGEKQVYGHSTLDVQKRYEQDGLRTVIVEPPDHVAIELEYASLLCYREAELLSETRDEEATRCRSRLGEFLDLHLAAWMPAFAARVSAAAATGFYRQLAALSDSFIRQEHASVCDPDTTPET